MCEFAIYEHSLINYSKILKLKPIICRLYNKSIRLNPSLRKINFILSIN